LCQGNNLTDKRQAWTVTIVTFLASIAAAINSSKVPPVMQVLMSELHVDMVTGGWLMSVSAVAGLLLAIPAAFLLAWLGPKISGLIALGCTVAGAVIGALAKNVTTLLLGRVIEGISLSLISVVAPAVISMWFEPQERGLPLGIWAVWIPIGNVITFNVAHPLLESFGWQAVWWFGALLAVVALVLFGSVVVAPPRPERRGQSPPDSLGRMLLNPSSWLLALVFGAFGFSLIGYNTWAASFLIDTLHIAAASASFYVSLMFLAAIPANIVAGWVLGRIENRHALLPAVFLIAGILFFWGFRLRSVSAVVPYMIALGFTSNFIPTLTFTFAPETMPNIEFAGLALAIANVGSSLGSLIGPPVLGFILSTGNWTAGSTLLVMAMGVGTVASWFVSRRLRAT
jgi:MFS family permease